MCRALTASAPTATARVCKRAMATVPHRDSTKVPFTVGKTELEISVPTYALDQDGFTQAVAEGDYHIGDIVWPSSVAFAEFLGRAGDLTADPHTMALGGVIRSWFSGKRVLELGSGMGLTGLSLMAAAGPASVTLSDRDPEVLAMASISIADNGFAESMATLPLDWQDKSQWPAQNLFDTFVATDVLYHGAEQGPLTEFLRHVLAPDAVSVADRDVSPKVCCIVEPVHDERVTATDGQAFERAAKAAGLGVVVGTLPGPRPMQLLRVTYE